MSSRLKIAQKTDTEEKLRLIEEGLLNPNEVIMATEFNRVVKAVEILLDKQPVVGLKYIATIQNYSQLPESAQLNEGYGVLADGLVYIWNGTSFQDEGEGFDFGLKALGAVEDGETRAVSGDVVKTYTDKYSLPLVTSYNLIDKSKIVFGNFDNIGTFHSHAAQPTKPNLAYHEAVVSGNKYYALVGVNAVNSPARFVWLDDDKEIISVNVGNTLPTIPIRIQAPEGAAFVSMTLSFNASGYESATDNSIANAVMLVEIPAIDSPIPPYRDFIYKKTSYQNIDGLDSFIEEIVPQIPTVEANSTAVEFLMSKYEAVYKYDGTAFNSLPTTYSLSEPGDYLELECKWGDTASTFNHGLSLIGLKDNLRSLIGIHSEFAIWMREVSSEGGNITWTLPTSARGFNRYKLVINEDEKWELFFNGVSLGARNFTSQLNIDCIGDAYDSSSGSMFRGEIKSVKIKAGALTYQNGDLSTGNNVEKEYFPIQEDVVPNYSDVYYSYNPAGYLGNEALFVYVKQKGSNDLFTRFNFYREKNNSELTYVDYFRICGATVCQYNGSNMVDKGITALVSAESEFTMLQNGKADHVGGYHGDELITSFKFLADGVELSAYDAAIPLTACNYFEAQVHSTMHDVATAAAPSTPISGHPQIATHLKRTVFHKNGYECENVVKFTLAQQMIRAYTGLVCMGKAFAAKGYDEYGNSATFLEANDTQKMMSAYAHEFYGSGTQGSCKIKSEVVAIHKPSNKNCELEFKEYSAQWITDRTLDSKYYRILGTTAGSPLLVTVPNEIWHFKVSVEFTSK